MNNKFIVSNIIRILLLILLQVLLLNELPFGRVYMMVYPLAILLLPVFTPRVLVLVLSFVIGLIIDWFSNGGGIHTASLTLIGYLRSFILDTFQPRSGWDKLDEPTLVQQGTTWYFYYTLIAFSIHHFAYFYLEVFSFSNFFATLFKTVLSIISSLIVVWMVSYFFNRNNRA